MSAYTGSCHCGAVGFKYETAIPPAGWSSRACQCSFCTRHGAYYTSDPKGAVRWKHRDASLISRYRFGHKTADFVFCGRCGGYLGAVTEEDGMPLMVINIRALDPKPEGVPEPQPMSYEGETAGDRNARRSTRWTPVASS